MKSLWKKENLGKSASRIWGSCWGQIYWRLGNKIGLWLKDKGAKMTLGL